MDMFFICIFCDFGYLIYLMFT